MRGHIDKLSQDGISGWVVDPSTPTHRINVKVELAGTPIAYTIADNHRSDLVKHLNTDGEHGFHISDVKRLGVNDQNIQHVEIFGQTANGGWHPLKRPASSTPPKNQYQSFDDAEGASKSADKLAALRLDQLPNRHSQTTPLKGLSVLDLGCNEGFFCGEALRQGAKRVVGIDAGPNIIKRAKERFPEGDFRSGSWWDLPDEKFDVIFFLSAIHYEGNQRRFLDKLAQHLTPTGTLVLECGTSDSNEKTWATVKRWDGIMRYPSHRMLTENLLHAYSAERKGDSVIQSGDPVPRSVYHANLKKSSVMVFSGGSKAGASAAVAELISKGITVFDTDNMLAEILNSPRYDWTALKADLLREANTKPEGERDFAHVIASLNHIQQFAELVALEAPTEGGFSIIDGNVLRHPALHTAVIEKLTTSGLSVLSVTGG